MRSTVELDPAAMTKEQAGLHFQAKAEERQREQSLDLTTAWAMTRALYPALFAKAFSGGDPTDAPKVRLVGSYSESAQIIPPPAAAPAGSGPAFFPLPKRAVAVPNDSNISALGLPCDCSFEEFRAADIANAGASPRNAAAIFEGLVALQVQRGISLDTARDAARERYPQLASELDHAAGANSQEKKVSRKAHEASAGANSKPSHLAAAAEHETAAAAQDKAGDTETAAMHRQVASYHRGQANRK